MAETEPRETAAAAAADTAIRTAVSVLVELVVIVGVMWCVEHRATLRARARHAARQLRRDRAPGDEGLQQAEFARAVADYSRGERSSA